MSRAENKDATYFNFFESPKEQINLDIGLSFPGSSSTQHASGSSTSKIQLMGKSLSIDSSDQQQPVRVMPLPLDEEVEINLAPTQWAVLDKRLEERQLKLVEKEEERCRTLNIGSSCAMENLKSMGAGENLNAPSAEVMEIEELSFYRAVASSREKNLGKRPMTENTENSNKKSRASTPCAHCVETPTALLELLAQMPGVMVVGPTGQKIEGILAKFGPDQSRVVCICHGDYFNMVGFVKHAGWDEVTNPMQKIKILPNGI